MFSITDTIVAIATPPGRGGIGVVRVSGPDVMRVACSMLEVATSLAPRHATLTRVIRDSSGSRTYLDQVIAIFFPAPHSYTGEDVVEMSAHGSPVILREIVSLAMTRGARLAEPGEFTLRAFLNGRIDLIQAEAVADLVDAVTPLQARVAFDQLDGTLTQRIRQIDAGLFDLVARLEASIDFPEEGFHFVDRAEASRELRDLRASVDALLGDGRRGRLIREGRHVAIVGKPNVGKSSLFNYLVGADRAIVTPQPGTTRDLVTERADLNGLVMTLVDTAGIRETVDQIEREGVRRARGAAGVADFAILMLDRSRPLDVDDHALLTQLSSAPHLLVVNKTDLPAAWPLEDLGCGNGAIEVSLHTAHNLEALRGQVAEALSEHDPVRDEVAVSNIRHIALLERASEALERGTDMVNRPIPEAEELILVELQDAKSALEEITGHRTSEDTLRHIFERFCIGK
ncbi:MAG: tRNA uridine-5-carboxymethylaminomethyl(34) synthesis GTPase MnmE [Acidobacteria bacterium]|nr:tRNA uridine-5-carboxymethylaminomethyl(34) synthesis GTPase MnmE [Acidobacteriota bacterium]